MHQLLNVNWNIFIKANVALGTPVTGKNPEKKENVGNQGWYFNVKYSFQLYSRDQYSPYKHTNLTINNFSGALQWTENIFVVCDEFVH